MAEIRYTIEYSEPENVKSEVPGEQTLRRSSCEVADAAPELSADGVEHKVENPENYVLSPVVTITKNEATYTKGDLKLQKVSVTENVSVIRNGVYQTVKLDTYPPVYADVPALQPIRDPGTTPEELMDREPPGRPGQPGSEERKTRIPMKFKQAANRVRRERSMPNRVDGEITLPNQPRRSSIPRLKTKPRTPKPEEDEFDKIYGEIVDSPVDIDVSLLNNKVDDPVKVENRFEEIIHDYDEGRIKPISVDPNTTAASSEINNAAKPAKVNSKDKFVSLIKKPTNIPKSTEKSKTVERIADKSGVERVKNATENNNGFTEKVLKITEKRKSIDKSLSVDRVRSLEKPKARLEKSTSVDTTTTTERIRNIDKPVSTEKIVIDKPKSRIPMLKRKSEAEIEVPKNVIPPKGSVSGNRIRVQDGINNVSKDDNDVKKVPIGIRINKKLLVDDGDIKGTYQRTVSKTSKNGDKQEIVTETVEIKLSYESDIAPENIIKDDATEMPNESVIKDNTIEIVELTPAIEVIETSSLQETTVEPYIEEIVDEPPTALISEINNEPVFIQEITELSPTVLETKALEPDQEINETEIEQAIKVTPVKVVPIEEFERRLAEDQKNIPNGDSSLSNGIKNGSDVLKKTEISNGPAIKDDSDEDAPIIKGKVSRMISRLVSKDEKDEPKKDPIEELPKPKTVLSKIAMFERQEPTSIMSRPKIREIKHKCYRPTHDPSEHKPKIINEVLKPVQRTLNFNANSNTDDYEPQSLEVNNNVSKTVKIEAVNVEIIPISTPVIADEVVSEETATATEIKPTTDENKEDFPEATNNDVKPMHGKVISETVENSNVIEYKPIEVELIEPTAMPIEKQPKHDENKTEYTVLRPVEIEYTELTNDIQPTSKVDKDEDVITINHENESVQFDAVKRAHKSPFDFTPTEHSHKIRNYDEDHRSNETPSLDYVLDKLSKYKSSFDETNLKKSKSTAELDLGDAVKGKVHEMITRMKSVDRLGGEKREVICAKERPRKKSVSEKIALFEGKLSYSSNDHPSSRSPKSVKKSAEIKMSPVDLQAKMAELSDAKLRLGRMTNMTYVVLANGQEMPVLATGTALLDKQLTSHVISAAIELGYRAIDAAYVYGNEREVGEGIRAKIQDGTVKREDLFIINKLWSTFHRQDLVEAACRRSLEAMGLDYFDLYLVHNPMSFKEGDDPIPKIANVIQYSKHDYLEAWYGMEQLVVDGLARSVGVSNFNSVQLQRVLERARVKPVINMVECHPYLSQQRLDDFCAERNVKLLTFGVLGSKGTPMELKGSTAAAIDDPLIQVMSAGLGITPAQLLIRYQIECGRTVVTKASSAAHLWDNLQALTISLTEPQLDAIRALNRNKRTFTFKGMGDTHKNYPFNIAF